MQSMYRVPKKVMFDKGAINGQKSRIMDSKNLTRNIISTLFSFISSITMTLLMICLVALVTIFNPNYINYEINKSGYCERILKSINEEFVSLGIPSGFDFNIMTHLVDLEQVKKDVMQYTDVIYGESEENLVAVGVYDKIYSQLKNDAQRREIKITKEFDDSLQYTSDLCYDIYVRSANFPYILQLRSFFGKLKMPIFIALIIFLSGTIFLIAFIYLINPKNKCGFLRYVIYSLTSSCIFLAFVSISFFSYGKISRLAVYEVLYYFLMSYINDIFLCLLISCLIIILLLSTCIILYRKSNIYGHKVKAKHMK